MCKISNEIKLCSCNTDIDQLKHYWVLHRFNKDKDLLLVGETMLPSFFDPKLEKYNRKTLLQMLNNNMAFDKPVSIHHKDRLEVSFKFSELNNRVAYGFEFNNGKWKNIEPCSIEWAFHHDQNENGSIKIP